jgi:hypothetical protein
MFLAMLLALAAPSDWVPARWPLAEPRTLELLDGSAVNCLLVESADPTFTTEAASRGIATLAVIRPGRDLAEAAERALASKFTGLLLEGDFPEGTAVKIRTSCKCPVVELTSRSAMDVGSKEPVIGTYQGVWAGIQVQQDGQAKAGPTGSPWIDTNSGFLRSARPYGQAAIWIGNMPPAGVVVGAARYAQVISDAAMAGGRWIVALDERFWAKLHERDAAALKDWVFLNQHLKFWEDHRHWRSLVPHGGLALVQDIRSGALLSGGILDMIAVKHTPVRPIPLEQLSRDALKSALMAVNVDAGALTPEQREILRAFARGGGTLLTGPPAWKDQSENKSGQVTLEKAELERLNDIWRDVQSMIGRRNLGARLFNVSSMLSNLVASPDGKHVYLHLVNFSDYPVESVTVYFTGQFRTAKLYSPESGERTLDVYEVEEGTGVDLDKVTVAATLRLE